MTKNMIELIKIYSMKSHKEYSSHLLDYSKDTLISIISELLTMYINDKNSSTLREILTVTLAGYNHNTEKIGFNGFRQNSYGEPINCEAKPKNIQSNSKKKLDGGSNFTDYTFKRLEKDRNANLNMLISGFVDGKLIYLLEFPFNSPSFIRHLQSQLEKKFPNGDVAGVYLRGASFSFNSYNDADINVIYVTDDIKKYKQNIQKKLFEYLCGVIKC